MITLEYILQNYEHVITWLLVSLMPNNKYDLIHFLNRTNMLTMCKANFKPMLSTESRLADFSFINTFL